MIINYFIGAIFLLFSFFSLLNEFATAKRKPLITMLSFVVIQSILLIVGTIMFTLYGTYVFVILIYATTLVGILILQLRDSIIVLSKNKLFSIVTVIIILSSMSFWLYRASRLPDISISENEITIAGIYGDDIQWDQVSNVIYINTTPKTKIMINGAGGPDVLFGVFQTEDYGRATLFVEKDSVQLVYFEARGVNYIISYSHLDNISEIESLFDPYLEQ